MPLDSKHFDDLWHRHDDLEFVPVGQKERLCIYAQNLTAWTEENCIEAIKSRDVVVINRSILMLTHQFFNYRAAIPKDHRNHFSDRGHICIFTVFERVYHRLNAELLRINPPILVETPAPPAPVYKVYQIGSFPIGEIEEVEDD